MKKFISTLMACIAFLLSISIIAFGIKRVLIGEFPLRDGTVVKGAAALALSLGAIGVGIYLLISIIQYIVKQKGT